MHTKRNGWGVIWRTRTWCEVVPLDDLKEHLMGDECWCDPNVLYFSKGGIEIDHISADGREENELREQNGQHTDRT